MIMSWVWCGALALSLLCSVVQNTGAALSSAVMQGAQSAVTLCISMAGAMCLWSGIGAVMEQAGISAALSRLFRPALNRLFPSTKKDTVLGGFLSANICANFLGLGNAATPMGIQSAKRLTDSCRPGYATDELCRLIVLNTASIQLIPTNVAAVRSSLGSASPFDILPAVWITSICSASMGLLAAWLMGKVWRND